MHAPAAYIASVSHASSLEPNFINSSQVHLDMAVSTFNNLVPPSESISTADVLHSKPKQRLLSQKIEEAGYISLIQESSTAAKARLRAVSQPQAHAWLRATPSPSLGLHLESSEMPFLSFAFDLKVINSLNSDSILEASMIPGSTAEKGERDKHLKNDGPCNEIVSYPDPDSQQLRVDYITATWSFPRSGDVIHPQLLGIWVWVRD
ncbi:hypothetical protein EMCRGX_G023453 [Ephydatia muelleri]